MKLNFLSKKFCRKKIISWVFLLCAFPSFLFSKNQIRLHKFDWEIAETPHFEVYYYPAVEDRLEEVISYLEEAYEETSAFFQYPLPRKIPFFIYENHLHFEENAIAPIGEETGGFSEPFKNRFVLPLFASQEELRHVIRHEFAHIVSFYLWYGGQWRSLSLARLYVYPIPLWIAEGIAEFTGNRPAKSIDEMAVREAFLGGYFVDLDKLGSFTHLEGYQVWQAYKQSENFFRFLKETYGDKEIREIVEEANKNFDVSSILEKTLKKDVFAVNRQWKEFLEKKYAFARVKKTPSEYGKLVSPDVPYSLSSSPAVRGDTLYFISSARGYDEIYARDIPGGKSRPLLKKRSFTYFDSLEKKYNSLACDKAGLWFSGNRNKRVYLLYLDEKKGKIKKKIRMDLDQITGIDVLDGERLVISAVKTGISDLYLFNHRTGETVRLTSDEFEERRFCRNGKTIYGSAERNYQKDLYIFDLDKKERRWLTDTPELTGNEEEDPWFYDGKLYFSADYDGIFNLYEAEFGGNGNLSGIRRLTDVRSGMFFPVAANGNFFFRGYERGSYSIYHSTSLAADSQPLALKTPAEREEILIKEIPFQRKPYRFKFSTDLIYPLLAFYFDEEGMEFYTLTYWQASDILSRHKTSVQLLYLTPTKEYEFGVSWIYQPRFFDLYFQLAGTRQTEFSIVDAQEKLSQEWHFNDAAAGVQFPFDSYNSLTWSLAAQREKYINFTTATQRETWENTSTLILQRDTLVARYLYPFKGSLSLLGVTQSHPSLQSDLTYQVYFYNLNRFYSLRNLDEQTMRFRLQLYASRGKDAQIFEAGGRNGVKGYLSKIQQGENISLLSLEYNIEIFPAIDYNLWWLVPPLYFKTLQGYLVTYAGSAFSDRPDFLYSTGVGFRLYTFIFEQFPLAFNFEWARGWEEKKTKFYFYLGLL